MPPHSKTVRGTLSNPKTQEAIQRGENENRSQLGDPTSLEVEKGDSSPSVPDPHVSQVSSVKDEKKDDDLPHSKKVRGTLANSSGKEINRTQLGDPASLKAETSDSRLDRETEQGLGGNLGGKSKL